MTDMMICGSLIPISIVAVSLATGPALASGQSPKVALLLTSELCSETAHALYVGKFNIGSPACEEIGPDLRGVFSDLPQVSTAQGTESYLLVPSIADFRTKVGQLTFQKAEMTVWLEWRLKEPSGATIWADIAEGSASHGLGTSFTSKKNWELIVRNAIKTPRHGR
jgi:hypothetical protein